MNWITEPIERRANVIGHLLRDPTTGKLRRDSATGKLLALAPHIYGEVEQRYMVPGDTSRVIVAIGRFDGSSGNPQFADSGYAPLEKLVVSGTGPVNWPTELLPEDFDTGVAEFTITAGALTPTYASLLALVSDIHEELDGATVRDWFVQRTVSTATGYPDAVRYLYTWVWPDLYKGALRFTVEKMEGTFGSPVWVPYGGVYVSDAAYDTTFEGVNPWWTLDAGLSGTTHDIVRLRRTAYNPTTHVVTYSYGPLTSTSTATMQYDASLAPVTPAGVYLLSDSMFYRYALLGAA